MSDGIIIAMITSSGALALGLINAILAWRTNSKKERQSQHAQVISRLEKIEGALDINGRGVQGLLRFELHELWGDAKKKGFASDIERANFLSLYDRYHCMGKNGIMDHIRDEFLELPFSKKVPTPRKKKEDTTHKKVEGEKTK